MKSFNLKKKKMLVALEAICVTIQRNFTKVCLGFVSTSFPY